MRVSWPVVIAGTGMHVPPTVVTNDDFARRLDTSDEWIVQRTGIRQRHFVTPQESLLPLAVRAARGALDDARVTPEQLDLIVCATITPEFPLPSTACLLQAELGCRWIPAYDMAAACSGFVWGFTTVAQTIAAGTAQTVLLVGCEVLSRITDMEDRSTAVLFGDAAAAVVLRASPDPAHQVLAIRQGADGARGLLITVPGGGSRHPASTQTIAERMHYMKMRGREVYKFAVTQMASIIRDTAADAGVKVDDVALIVPHQSNLRIIESACEKAGIPLERVFVNIDRYGNTSSASVGLALHEARAAGRVHPGELVMLVAFGAGLTWGSVLLRI